MATLAVKACSSPTVSDWEGRETPPAGTSVVSNDGTAFTGTRPARRMVIASCINSMETSGGTELNAVRMVEQLTIRGYEVVVLTFDPAKTAMVERYNKLGVTVSAFPVGSLIGFQALRQIRRMAQFMKNQRIDVVLTHDIYTNFLMVLAARVARIPVIASKRYVDYARRRHRYTDLLGYSLADAILANSEAVADTVRRRSLSLRRKVRVVHNFVDTEVLNSKLDRDSVRVAYGLTSDQFVFGIVAQLRSEKNHVILLEAFAELAARHSGLRLLIVGGGPDQEQIKRAIVHLNLDDSVVLTGQLANAWETYAAMDVAVLPSRHEGFPNSLLEAMAMGIPVVASRVGGIPDLVEDGVNGLLVEPGNIVALLTAMDRLRADNELRRTLSSAGRDAVVQHFTAGSAVAGLEGVMACLERR